jgi:hypothetical protein
MNLQDLKNRGITIPFLFIALLVIGGIVTMIFVPGNTLYHAPIVNKLLAGLFLVAAAWWARCWAKDKFSFTVDWKVDHFIYAAVLIGLLALAFLIFGVWHSGPIGLTTNPVK